MSLSYTEELVAEYYKHLHDENYKPKYIVTTHQMFKAKGTDKAVKGWRDIDVLAFGKKDILVIQTKSMANFKKNWNESKPAIISFSKKRQISLRVNTRSKTRITNFREDSGILIFETN